MVDNYNRLLTYFGGSMEKTMSDIRIILELILFFSSIAILVFIIYKILKKIYIRLFPIIFLLKYIYKDRKQLWGDRRGIWQRFIYLLKHGKEDTLQHGGKY